MSGRVGRIEKAIVALLTRFPDLSFSVDDLCIAAYPGVVIGKAQRDTVMRVMRKRATRPTSDLAKLMAWHEEVSTNTDAMAHLYVGGNKDKVLWAALNHMSAQQWDEQHLEEEEEYNS
jgi:hypothetical protein